MLHTEFPRLWGDIGQDRGFCCQMERYYVTGANSKSVVLSDCDLCDEFVSGALQLQENGCDVITTSCGFLVKYQRQIADRLRVPFVSSSLLIYSFLKEINSKDSFVGILTANRERLMNLGYRPVDVDAAEEMNVAGMEDTYFYKVYVENAITEEKDLDKERLYKNLLEKAWMLKNKRPGLRCVLLECTNMSPFKARLKEDIGVEIYDLSSVIELCCGFQITESRSHTV